MSNFLGKIVQKTNGHTCTKRSGHFWQRAVKILVNFPVLIVFPNKINIKRILFLLAGIIKKIDIFQSKYLYAKSIKLDNLLYNYVCDTYIFK